MSQLKIVDASFNELSTLDCVSSCVRTEKINADNVLNFALLMKNAASAYINSVNCYELDGDYFDLACYNKAQLADGKRLATVECEHVSYRLNDPDYDKDYFTKTGTPTYILGQILDGTGFTVGTVDFTDSVTYSAQEKKSRRQILMEFVATLEGEVQFDGFEVSILQHRGSATPRELIVGYHINVVSNTYNKRETDNDGNPLVSYACEVVRNLDPPLALGDEMTIDYDDLDIDIALRVVSISYDPYNPQRVNPIIEIGNYINALEDSLYRIATLAINKEMVYNGCRIGPEFGFEAVLSDNMARSFFNSTAFKMQVGDGGGANWTDVLYFDPVSGTYKFTGNIIVTDGTNTATFTSTELKFQKDPVDVFYFDGNGDLQIIGYITAAGLKNANGDTLLSADGKLYINYLTSLNIANPILRLFSHGGTAQAGAQQGITLAAAASANDDTYVGMDITITGGTGSGQTKNIVSYSGYDRVAGVDTEWATQPNNTSVYLIEGSAIDATENYEVGIGSAIRFKWNKFNYLSYYTDRCDYYFTSLDADTIPNIRPTGFYIGNTLIAGVVEVGGAAYINTDNSVVIFVQADEPEDAKTDDIWVDTDDYSRYDITPITAVTTLAVNASEVITVSGTFNLTLHAATAAGIIKRILNIGTGTVTIIGTINGTANMNLFPGEGVELITDGTGWRY